MQVLSTKVNQFLLVSLLSIVVLFIMANLVNPEYVIYEDWFLTDILFIIIPVIVIILGIILSSMYKGNGYHGKAWVLFTIAIAIWFAGEMTYQYDAEYDLEDISTLTSDILYILGYPIFFAFTALYLKPRRKSISKNMILVSVLISIAFVVPTIYFTFEGEGELDSLTIFLYAIYPILDGLVLVPSIIAVTLFFKGQVNFLWTLVLFATLADILGDTLYLILAVEEAYYPGHPVDILFLFAYVFYAFGVYSHIKLYKKPSNKK